MPVRGLKIFCAFLLALFFVPPAYAQLSIVGEWAGRYHEDAGDRILGDVQGDFTGVPINEAARRYADAYDVWRVSLTRRRAMRAEWDANRYDFGARDGVNGALFAPALWPAL